MRNPPPVHIDTAPQHREPFYKADRPVPAPVLAKSKPASGSSLKATGFGSSAPRSSSPRPTSPSPNAAERPRIPPRLKNTIGRTVYQRNTRVNQWFRPGSCHSYDTVLDPLPPTYTPADRLDETLVFDSRFESGNLEDAKRVGEYEYDLRLQTDMYTNRHTQWFYFSVQNMRKGKIYTFNITNLLKSDSLYNYGMQPVVYSNQAAARDQTGWLRGGTAVRYFRTKRRVDSTRQERQYYTLTWKYEFKEEEDEVFFAHCYPYTYTMLQDYLTALAQDPFRSSVCKQRVLCQSLGGNVCDVLTVTHFGGTSDEMKLRRGVVVTSRIHPGESNASWMMKGFIDFITSDDPDAATLREHFVFKIVPMLNPDGVITGNYRTGLAGVDLNRVYKTPIRELYPTIYNMKAMMKRLAEDREVVLYCDLHGHSRKQNVFAYGCSAALMKKELHMAEQVFIRMLELNGPSHFSLKSSRFHVKRAKESTGRVNTWRTLRLQNCFTIEATFCGSTIGPMKGLQFSHRHFEQVGVIMCDAIMDYYDPDEGKKSTLLAQLREDLATRPSLGNRPPGCGDSSGEEDASSPGSNSSDDDAAAEEAQEYFRKTMGTSFTYEAPPSTRTHKLKTRKERNKRRPASKKEEGKKPAKPKPKVSRKAQRQVNRLSQPKARESAADAESGPGSPKAGRREKFVSKYDGRTNNGVPTFSEEQAIARQQAKPQSAGQRRSMYRYDIGSKKKTAAAREQPAPPSADAAPAEEPDLPEGDGLASQSWVTTEASDALKAALVGRLLRVDQSELTTDTDTEPESPLVVTRSPRPPSGSRPSSTRSHAAATMRAGAQPYVSSDIPTQQISFDTGGQERPRQPAPAGQGQEQDRMRDADLVMSTLDMLRHKVHDQFCKEQQEAYALRNMNEESWSYVRDNVDADVNLGEAPQPARVEDPEEPRVTLEVNLGGSSKPSKPKAPQGSLQRAAPGYLVDKPGGRHQAPVFSVKNSAVPAASSPLSTAAAAAAAVAAAAVNRASGGGEAGARLSSGADSGSRSGSQPGSRGGKRPDSGQKLDPISVRRCVCDAQARHDVRELRGHFGIGHKCIVCHGYVPGVGHGVPTATAASRANDALMMGGDSAAAALALVANAREGLAKATKRQ